MLDTMAYADKYKGYACEHGYECACNNLHFHRVLNFERRQEAKTQREADQFAPRQRTSAEKRYIRSAIKNKPILRQCCTLSERCGDHYHACTGNCTCPHTSEHHDEVIIESPKTTIPAEMQSASSKAVVGLSAAEAIFQADPEMVLAEQDAALEVELDQSEDLPANEELIFESKEETAVHKKQEEKEEEKALVIITPTPVEAVSDSEPKTTESLQVKNDITALADGSVVVAKGMDTKEVFLLRREKIDTITPDGFFHSIELKARAALASFGTTTVQNHIGDIDDIYGSQVTRNAVCVTNSYWLPSVSTSQERVSTNYIRTAGFNSYRRGLVYYSKLQDLLRSSALQRRSAIRADETLSESYIDAVAGELQGLFGPEVKYDIVIFENTVIAGWNAFMIRSIMRMEAIGKGKVNVPVFRNAALLPHVGSGLASLGWVRSFAMLRRLSPITENSESCEEKNLSTPTARSSFQESPIQNTRTGFTAVCLAPLSPILV